MAVVGSSATGARLLADPSFTDVTDSGTLDLSSRQFTTSTSLETGAHYIFQI